VATAFTAWDDDVVPNANGCPLPVVRQKVRAAAIEFCRLSRAWRHLGLTPLDAVASQQTYVIGTSAATGTLPADTAVAHIFQVNYNGVPLDPLTPAQLKGKGDLWFSEEGDPEAFACFKDGQFSLWRIPGASTAGAIVVPDVALEPSQAAATVDDMIFQRYREAVAKGALARIHAMPGKPYTDLQLAGALDRDFRAEAGSANVGASSSRGHARLRTQTIIR
jgi:hypothetical protein